MSDIVKMAMDTLMAQPKNERDRIAWEIIERLEDKNEWDEIVSSTESQKWLAKLAASALQKYTKMDAKLANSPISLASKEFSREEAYWTAFSDLPKKLQKMAEDNYRLWRDNPDHPSLRFKKIHDTKPIFSFRVGLKNRTIGVQTRDDKMAWFWVGSFENYDKAIRAK